MSSSIPSYLKAGAVAVITGAAQGGIGFEIASIALKRHGMKAVLVDQSQTALDATSKALVSDGVAEEQFTTRNVDVSDFKQMKELADDVYKQFNKVDFLVLNAGTSVSSKSFGGDLEPWNKLMSVNFGGVLNGTQAFVERMISQDSPAGVVITGSKQGITNPPGNPAYNVSKAAVKSLAESLAHDLIPTQVTAHLLVPGYTYTKLTTGGGAEAQVDASKKPAAAWTAAQVAEELFARLDEFYIICPDNDVKWELDQARMRYNLDDILLKRPALSRWNPEYAEQYNQFVAKETEKK
ncbi:hypothetical protein JCM5350_004819 [Sporobolomyces pararoseus]